MNDGLYIVDKGSIYGAFVVKEGHVTSCAPILRKNLGFYMKIAQFVPTVGGCAVVAPEFEYPPPWRKGCE